MSIDPITSALDIGGKLIDRLWPDPQQKAAAQLELLKLQQSGELASITGQTEINKQEASNPSLLVSGGRPFIIWVCGVGFAVEYVANPILTWITMLVNHPTPVPHIPVEALLSLLVPMLGLAGYRTIEKIKGVAAK